MVYEECSVVPHRSAKFQIFPITNSRLSASLVLNCINFLFQNFWFLIFFWKKFALKKKVYLINFVQFWILYSEIFFLAKIPYFNYQINFQSSHLTKKETEDASKRLSSYCMGALNCKINKIPEYYPIQKIEIPIREKIANIEMTTDALFDSFIFELIYSFFRNS